MKTQSSASILFIAFQLLILQTKANAQQNITLDEVEKAYLGDFTITANAVYKYYPDFNRGPASDSLNAFMAMNGMDYYFKIAEYEMIQQGQYNITVDNDAKAIEVNKEGNEKNSLSYGIIDNLLKQQNAKLSEFSTGDESFIGIRIKYENSDIVHADLYIDKQTHFIKKCVIKYVDGVDEINHSLNYAKIDIIYSEYRKINLPLSETNYKLSKFVVISANNIALQSSYESYHLETN